MQFKNSRTGEYNKKVSSGIGIKGSIIPEFLDEIEVSTNDPQLILYLATAFNRIDIVEYFKGKLYEEIRFADEKAYVQIIAEKYGYNKILAMCENFDG